MPPDAAISPEQYSTFGALLKYLRQRAGLTQRELSIAVGYTESHISRLEHDQRAPDAAVLAARFVPALGLEHEPAWVARLLALASDGPPQPAAAPEPPAPREPVVTPTNLPAELTSFVGRVRELAEIQRALTDPASRLLTLGGAGGCGKTRLALRAAARLLGAFPGGVWLVDLSRLASTQHVAPAVVSTLGLLDDAKRPPLAVAAGFLKPRTALLILDNCEHLVAECAETAEALLQACPDLRVLATSREMLGVPGEHFFRVPSLLTPDPNHLPPLAALAEYEAVRLFLERARAVYPGLALTPDTAQPIAQICWQLDGIPLALELAAARVRTLRVEEIAARLAEQGHFRLLTGGSRTAPTRQQTLQAMIEWSCHLLSAPERVLFRRLSVFAGGFSLEAAELVAADAALPADEVLDLLTQLVNKSLVVADRRAELETRYRLLESIRQYAREMLASAGEAEAVQHQHLACYLALARRAEPHLRGPEQARWLDQLEADYGNLRAALAWSQAAAITAGLELAAALLWFWHLRGHHTAGQRTLEALLAARTEAPAAVRAAALTTVGFLLSMLSREAPATERLRASLDLWRGLAVDGRRGAAYALAYLMDLTPDLDQALAYGEESRAALAELDDPIGLAEVHVRLANHARARGDWARTEALEAAQLALVTRAGDLDGQATAHVGLGKTAYARGAYRQALEHFQRAYELYRQVGNHWGLSYVLIGIGRAALAQGDLERAGRQIEAARDLHQDLGHCVAIGISSFHLGRVAALQSDDDRAADRYGEALAQFREAGAQEQMTAALLGLARAAHGRGEAAAARAHYTEALRLAAQLGHRAGVSHALRGLAAGQPAARAARLYAAASRLGAADPRPTNGPTNDPNSATQDLFTVTVDQVLAPHEEQAMLSAALDGLRVELGAEAFAAAWSEGEAMSLAQALEYALSLAPG